VIRNRSAPSPDPTSANIFNSIVFGDLNGQLAGAFTKLTTLHSKNSFSFAIATGNLFAEDDDAVSDLLTGKITIPLTTYFTVGTRPLPQRIIEKIEKDEEVSLNVTATKA
jgi:RNAse (barnase) inhibitor barstar